MSISRRTAVAVRTLGVASAAAALSLGFTGSAFACVIGDFQASVACDSTSGTGTVTVTDNDANGPTAQVSLYDGHTKIGDTLSLSGGTAGSPGTVSFTDVPWKTSGKWTVHVTVKRYINDETVTVKAPGTACSAPSTGTPTGSPTGSTPTGSPTGSTPTGSPTGSTPTTTATSTPTKPSTSASPSSTVDSTATASATPTGPTLAETGGGNDSGLIAGIAGALVIAGGGVVFALRRRSARH